MPFGPRLGRDFHRGGAHLLTLDQTRYGGRSPLLVSVTAVLKKG